VSRPSKVLLTRSYGSGRSTKKGLGQGHPSLNPAMSVQEVYERPRNSDGMTAAKAGLRRPRAASSGAEFGRRPAADALPGVPS
jgi:hypothetical protein